MSKLFYKKNSISYLFFFLPLFFFLFIHYTNQVEDIWFLLSHGQYVVHHGIPHTEFLTIHHDLCFVMQQWGFSVILYLIYHFFGSIGINLFVGFINVLILFSLYKLCMLISKNNKYFSCIVASVIDLLLQFNFILPRPQIISLLLLILTLYILEDYYVNSSKKLYFLPVLSILLVNFHASIWPMLFVFCMPFVIEFLNFYLKKKDKRLFLLLFVIFLSVLISFINPYGIEALVYTFHSYGISLFNQLIVEMHSFSLDIHNYTLLCNSSFVLFVIIINLFFIIKNSKKCPIHYYFFFFGLSFMAVMNLRNLSFLLIGTLPFVVLNFHKKEDYKIANKVYFIGFIFLIFIYGINCCRGGYTIKNTTVNELVHYLDENKNNKDNLRIFTYFDDGPYFEYSGYKVYMDTRAEVFLKKNNKKEDIFDEYYRVLIGDIDYDQFIDKYQFTHLVVPKDSFIYYYLQSNDYYKIVCRQGDNYLYEKDYSIE